MSENIEHGSPARLVEARPIAIALSNAERIRHYLDVSPETLRRWNEEGWFPIRWKGQGKGRRGIVVLNEAERAIQSLPEDPRLTHGKQ